MPHASADRGRGLPWRPIAEVPPDAKRIIAFDPAHWGGSENAITFDERVCTVSRHPDGWWFEHGHGGYLIKPTMFCSIELPEGADPDPR